ncbi:MAG: hypothetical protein ACREIT_12470 [Tepidisphaeraceae bacterium]
MWGNKLGWGISAAIVIFAAGVVMLINAADALTPATDFGRNNLGKIELPVVPSTVVAMDQTCDAGDLYRQAVVDYTSNLSTYNKLRSTKRTAAELARLKGVQLLVQATRCNGMTMFSRQPERVISYDSDRPQLEALQQLGETAIHAGMLHNLEKNPVEAMKYFDAAFALGAKLYAERLVYAELHTGLGLMGGAADRIMSTASMANDPSRGTAAQDFLDAYQQYDREKIRPMAQAITTIDQDILERQVGDVFLVAKEGQEPMWRVEAALKLGRYKFNAGRAGDQRGARRLLRYLVNDSDPNVKLAAQKGLELELIRYRQLR